MGIVTKYKFNQNVYENFIPEFNSGFTYTITDEIDTDGFTIRTIESGGLPTAMRFGAVIQTDREKSLLEVYECNTEKVTSMSSMFNNCSSLTSLDVSNFDTSSVTIMEYMFSNCSKLTSLDVSNFNTSNVDDMGKMFYNCSSLTSLDISNFNTSNVISMYAMFNGCSSLTSLDLSNFNTSNVTNMRSMFQNCSSLTSLDVSNFNTENVTNMQDIFYRCSSLTFLDVSSFNTSELINMQGMFARCSNLIDVNVSSFNVEKVVNMQGVFSDCTSLKSLDLSHWNTKSVQQLGMTFNNCTSLKSINLSNFNTDNVIDMSYLFSNCKSLISLNISNFSTNKVRNMSYMFQNCKINLLDISNFIINESTNVVNIFLNYDSTITIGMIYCNSDTINKVSDLIRTDTTIWYSDAKLEDLTKKSNITYKEYKMNILESDEEINLRRFGDIYDELNLETGELIQRIEGVVITGNETDITKSMYSNDTYSVFVINDYNNIMGVNRVLDLECTPFTHYANIGTPMHDPTTREGISYYDSGSGIRISILNSRLKSNDIDGFRQWLLKNNVFIQFILPTPIIKTINLKGKPSINWQGDTYLHLENNTLYPQLDCEIESINYYEIPKLKANTLYTLRYVGEPTQCIFGGLTYETENNMVLTSGSSDNLLYFDKEVRKVVLIEGDVRDRNFDYFEGIESLGAVEIITHKSDMPIFAKGGRK